MRTNGASQSRISSLLDSGARTVPILSGDVCTTSLTDESQEPLHILEEQFREHWLRRTSALKWRDFEAKTFSQLRAILVNQARLSPANPRRNIKDDQIVWGRSPIRLDIAGGWSDTPPYCLHHGGRVLNLAAEINGQPPIQVFARLCERPEIVLRSIDMGIEERVSSFDELCSFDRLDSSFALAKAAIALSGFVPQFHVGDQFRSLKHQLLDFGGGIELSVMSGVPKGSGLGTSSILGATILSVLSELCSLGWSRDLLFSRTLVLEQMLTAGGGWQDQAGALFRGLKLIETTPGIVQKPSVRWLPAELFSQDYANKVVLLYYTGITRMAKGILADIVRRIFLNLEPVLKIIADISANASIAGEAIQKCDYQLLADAVKNSWELNQLLHQETNPSEVRRIIRSIQDFTFAVKLLGAGGGGYLLIFAKDETAAGRIRKSLSANAPNDNARMVKFTVSECGTQVTRS